MPAKPQFFVTELLFPVAIIIAWMISGFQGRDIHIGDTYYVMGLNPWASKLIYVPFYLLLLLTWLLHIPVRQKNLMPVTVRRLQVGISVISLFTFIVLTSWPDWFITRPTRYLDYSSWSDLTFHPVFYRTVAITALTFIVCQLVFWIAAVIVLIRAALYKR